jgi:hypothetical protein
MLTLSIISFALISLMMVAMGIGALCHRPGIRGTCGKTIEDKGEEGGNEHQRCAACTSLLRRRCRRP